ncbi:hypothetical protein RP20_CCG019181 [Aedes albopictus]|nr:hypothetical protein RP20_CCG019181 [Aedes albopictus]
MLFAILLVAFFIYLFQKWTYTHWKRRGIPQLCPRFPLGEVSDTIRQRTSYSNRVAELHHQAVRDGHRFVGIYTLCQPVLLVTDVNLVRRILTVDFEYFADRGAHINETRNPLSGHLIYLTGDKWRQMRQKLSPGFSTAKLNELFPTMMTCGRTLTAVIDKIRGRSVPLHDLMTRFTVDVIASIGFGVECNSMWNPDEPFRQMGARSFLKSWKTSLRMLLAFVAPRFLQLKLIDGDVEEYMRCLVRDAIARREAGEVRRDFMQMLVQLRNQVQLEDGGSWEMSNVDQNKAFTVEEMAAQSFVFLNGGYDTISSTLTFCMFELCRNESLLRRIHEEIVGVLADDRELCYEALEEMTFLESCIDETLRKYPISPVLFRVCTKAYQIPDSDVVVEKGTLVQISLVGLQRDPRYYEDPLKFDPERYGERRAETMPHFSFGDGPRVCPGQQMSKAMIKMALVQMLADHDCRLEAPATMIGELELDPSLLTLQPKKDVLVVPFRRVVINIPVLEDIIEQQQNQQNQNN